MDQKFKIIITCLIVVGCIFLVFKYQQNTQAEKATEEKKLLARAAKESQGPEGNAAFKFQALPSTNRNQGLEDLKTEIQSLKDEIRHMGQSSPSTQPPREAAAAKGDPYAPSSSQPIDLNKSLPPPVSFDQPAGPGPKSGEAKIAFTQEPEKDAPPPPPQFKVWPAEKTITPPLKDKERQGLVIPVNSALESVMLSGINAKPSGSISGAAGSVNSANDVGAPFVTRIKGDAILPNGWKLNDLGDCFLGGSGVAVLSAERVYTISNTISCIAPDGEVYESPIKAFGLDADGTQGIAGKVVSKQGAILMQAAITGIASGLGSALSPSTLPQSNTLAESGSQQGMQTVNPRLVAQTAVGTGINQAAGQLSRFYLEFARETFPVIEVVAGTRITWILKQSIEFKRTKKVLSQ